MTDTSLPVDIIVLTAVDLEYSAVREFLTDFDRVKHPGGTVFEVGTIVGSPVRVGLVLVGMGNRAAAAIFERAVAMFQPRAAIFAGIAGALHTDLELGDIVVASRIYAVQGGKLSKEGYQTRPRVWDAPHELLQEAHHLAHTDWRRRLPRDKAPADHIKVVFRPIAASEVVVNSSAGELVEQVRSTFNDTAAFDMESSGAAEAAHLNQNLPMLTIRGISDRVDGDKDLSDLDGWQHVAAASAAAFAVALIAARSETAVPVQVVPLARAATGKGGTRTLWRRRSTLIAAAACLLVLLPVGFLATQPWRSRAGASTPPDGSVTTSAVGQPSVSPTAAVGTGNARPAEQSRPTGVSGLPLPASSAPPTSIVITPASGSPTTRFVVSGQCGPPCRQWPENEGINILWVVGGEECHSQQLQTLTDGTIWAAALKNESDGIVEFDFDCPALILKAGETYQLMFRLYALKPGLNTTVTLSIT